MSTAGILLDQAGSCPRIFQNTLKNNKEGIIATQAAYPVIQNNTIKQNTGNAITVQNCFPVIEKNILRENSLNALNLSFVTTATISSNEVLRNKRYGIYSWLSGADITNNMIAFNSLAGIYFRDSSVSKIYFNTLYLNGDGISLKNCSPEIVNNILLRNENYGILEAYYFSDPLLRNNCFWENEQGNYKDEGTTISWTTQDFEVLIDNDGASVEGNFAENPRLADVAHENFHLLPLSPCIDSAFPVSGIDQDFEDNLRAFGSQDIGADEYNKQFYYSFETDSQGWKFGSIPSVFTSPVSSDTGGKLMLRSQDSSTYGFWESPWSAIPIFENLLYRGSWLVSTDVTDQSLVPGLRLRYNEQDFEMAAEMLVNSNLNGDASPTTQGVTYEFLYRPLQGSSKKQEKAGDVICSFDLINFSLYDQSNGALFLEEFTLDWFDIAGLEDKFTTDTVFEFDGGTEGWNFESVPGVFDTPTEENGPSFLGLRSVSSYTYGFWESPPQDVTAGNLYRIRFYVSTDVASRSEVPMIRLRVNSVINQSATMVLIDSSLEGDSSPVPSEWTPYDVYFVPPPSVEADGVLLAFDLVNFNPKDAEDGAIFLSRVEVHHIPPPFFDE